MIFPFERVPVPNMGGYVKTQGNRRYYFVYVGERLLNEKKGRTTHSKAKCIGRLEPCEQGDELMPNEFYYELMGLSEPSVAVKEGVGRKPYHQKAQSLEKRASHSEIAMGYGLTITVIARQLGLDEALEDAFGHECGRNVLALAAFLCERQRSSLSNLDQFIGTHLACSDFDFNFGRREAGELLTKITPQNKGAFYESWIKRCSPSGEIFYDVTSFSTWSGQIIQAHYGYNRDHEELVQINQGLFCDHSTGLPLFMLSYDGSLNDKQNFNAALAQARSCGLDASGKKHLTIVMDGGFSRDNFNWCHLLGYDFIAGVSCDHLRDVRKAYLDWSRSITENDRADVWMYNDHPYISKAVPLNLGGLDGTLMMYRDLEQETLKRSQLSRQREAKRQELENTQRAPQDRFDAWAKSFAPFFRVERSRGRKGFIWEEDVEAVRDAMALCGKVSLFTHFSHKKVEPQQVLKFYREKESVEDCFDTTKNGLCDKRLHVHGDVRAEGKLFVMFIALILRRTIHDRLKEQLEKNVLTTEDAIDLLEQIKFYKDGDNWRLKSAISKQQREIITALKLEIGEKSPVVKSNLFKPRMRKGRKTKNGPKRLDEVLDQQI